MLTNRPLPILVSFFFCFQLPNAASQNGLATTIPFRLVRNLVVVEAKVNGKTGQFIVDTGAAGVTLNDRFFNGIPTGETFHNISGAVSEARVDFIRLNLGGFEKKECAVVTDFSAIEKVTGLTITGVIGNSFFSKFQVVLDYVFSELTLYQLDKSGNCLCPKPFHQSPPDTLRFAFKGNIPGIEVKVGGRKIKMGLDSGAGVCVLEERLRGKLEGCLSMARNDSLASFGNTVGVVNTARLGQLEAGKLTCPPLKTVFISLEDFNYNLPGANLDGILGYEFLSKFRVAINYRKKEIYLWDLPTVEQQWAQVKPAKQGEQGH